MVKMTTQGQGHGRARRATSAAYDRDLALEYEVLAGALRAPTALAAAPAPLQTVRVASDDVFRRKSYVQSPDPTRASAPTAAGVRQAETEDLWSAIIAKQNARAGVTALEPSPGDRAARGDRC
jgi:hypothetical protein